jgi:hypothetical protein
MLVRQVHAYFSVFVSPTLLFFAFTGILQLYSLHEAHGAYQPPGLIERLGRVHKDQTFSLERKHREATTAALSARVARGPAAAGEGDWVKPLARSDHDDQGAPPLKTQALKALFCAAAVMLVVSALLGVWMAVTQNRRKIVLLAVFLIGAAAPVAILLL